MYKIQDLEAALQMKPGSIYAAFKSKEGLYLEALAYYGESFEQRLGAVAEVSDTPLKTLANFMRSQVKADEKGVLRAVSYTHTAPTRLKRISYAVICFKKK